MAKAKRAKKHLPRQTYMDIMQGLGGEHDPVATYNQAGPRQRKGFRRKARARGKTMQGLLSGGPVALQEKSRFGVRRQAARTIKAAYAPAENEVKTRERQAIALNQKQQADELMYAQWEMSEQAKLNAQAATADQAFRDTLTANQIQENAAWQEAQGAPASTAGSSDAAGYQAHQVGVAREAAQGASAARRDNALAAADEGKNRQRALGEATLTNAGNRRRDVHDKFHAQLATIAADRKDISLRRAADEEKEVARLHDQQVDVASANRDWKATKRTLGIKEFDAESTRIDEAGKRKLASQTIKQNGKIKRLERRLKRDDLTRKERADTQAHLDRVMAEKGRDKRSRRSAAAGGENGGGKVTAGQKKVWGGVEETVQKGRLVYQKKGGTDGHSARAIAQSLRKRGYTPLQAKAAAEIIKYGHVRKETARAIRAGGGYVPKSARG